MNENEKNESIADETANAPREKTMGRRTAIKIAALVGVGGYALARLGLPLVVNDRDSTRSSSTSSSTESGEDAYEGAFGEKLVLPEVDEAYAQYLREPTLPNFFFAPDSSRVAIVAGDLSKKLVYVGPWRAKSPADYKLVAEFDDCYKCDGICFDGDELICRVSSFTFACESPKFKEGSDYQRAWNEALSIRDPSFSIRDFQRGRVDGHELVEGALVRVHADGSVTKLCARPASTNVQATTTFVKTASGMGVCLERDLKAFYRYDLSSAEPASEVESIAQTQGASQFLDLSYDAEQDAVYACDSGNVYRIDPEAPSASRVMPTPGRQVRPDGSRAPDAQFVSNEQMSGANFFYLSTLTSHAVWQKLPTGQKYSYGYPNGASFLVWRVAPNGDLVFVQFIQNGAQTETSTPRSLDMSQATPQEATEE